MEKRNEIPWLSIRNFDFSPVDLNNSPRTPKTPEPNAPFLNSSPYARVGNHTGPLVQPHIQRLSGPAINETMMTAPSVSLSTAREAHQPTA